MSAIAKIHAAPHEGTARSWAPAALACMGVLFGDIGTSPLYTLNVAAKSASPTGQVSPEAVLGIVSLIFWSLIVLSSSSRLNSDSSPGSVATTSGIVRKLSVILPAAK